MLDNNSSRKVTTSKRFASMIVVLMLLVLSHLVYNESRFFSQYQIRSVVLETAIKGVNRSSSYSDLSVAEMAAKLDELNENMKLLLARSPAVEAKSSASDAAATALQAATAAMTSTIALAAPQSASYESPPFPYHVLYGLEGDEPGFLEEFEVSLKSILLNAPLDDPLQIHIMASGKAFAKLDKIFQKCLLDTFRTRNPITFHVYNVQPLVNSWKVFMDQYFTAHWRADYNITQQTERHTIGTFFRLFAHHVIPSTVHKMLYLDSDAILMANMRELWKDVASNNPGALFHWGNLTCAGFMVLDNHKIQEIWTLAASDNLRDKPTASDQDLLIALNNTFPEKVGILPPAWDVSIANTIWKYNDELLSIRPNLGMMHFNGGGEDPRNAFQVHDFLTQAKLKHHPNWINTFHLAHYYGNMPWEWTRYWANSMVTNSGESGGGKKEGYPITIFHHENLKPLYM